MDSVIFLGLDLVTSTDCRHYAPAKTRFIEDPF